MTSSVTVEMKNKKGLHARAAAKFVKIVAGSKAQVTVTKLGDDTVVQGASILGLMMLGAEAGSKLRLTAEGEGERQVITELKQLIESRFGEPE